MQQVLAGFKTESTSLFTSCGEPGSPIWETIMTADVSTSPALPLQLSFFFPGGQRRVFGDWYQR